MYINQISELESSLDALDQPGKPEVLLQLLSYYQTKDLSKARFYARMIEQTLIEEEQELSYQQTCQLLERLQHWYEFYGDIDQAYNTLKRLHQLQSAPKPKGPAHPMEHFPGAIHKIDKHLLKILDTIHLRVCFLDKHLVYQYANQAYKNSVGYPHQTIIGKTANEVLGKDALDSVQYYINRAFEGEQVGYRQEMDYKQGKKFMDTSIYPIQSEGTEEISGCLVITEDITRIQNMSRELSNSREALAQFAHATSHDLKEPIRSIVSFTQLLNKKLDIQLDKEQVKWLKLVVTSAKRLHSIIDDLEKYADLHKQLERLETIDLNESLRRAILELEDPIRDSQAIIQYQALPSLFGSSKGMEILFFHLLENAIKFSAPGRQPEIKIHYSESLNAHHITFQDNGIGFKNIYKDKIFKLFKRLHKQDTIPGTGIGLASCQKVIVKMGGQIRAEAIEGEGSTIYITLPKHTEKLREPALLNSVSA
ncbi:MAG: ATP-binding protein [Bacteroidota bacterium]